MAKDQETVPVQLPASLIIAVAREVGSLEGVNQWITEAARVRLAGPGPEQRFDSAPAQLSAPAVELPEHLNHAPEPAGDGLLSVSATELPMPPSDATLFNGSAAEVVDDVLFGLHNRDYPSLWALAHLAQFAHSGSVPLDAFFDAVADAATDFNRRVLEPLREGALFPRVQHDPSDFDEMKKIESSRNRFLNFAVAEAPRARSGDGATPAAYRGPLPQWKVAAIDDTAADGPMIGLTAAGRDLLHSLNGLNVVEPHGEEHARAFLKHLRRHASEDHLGFRLIVEAIGDGNDRTATNENFVESWTAQTGTSPRAPWKLNEGSTNTAGYVARAREWGLVEPKQRNRRYHLTTLGEELRSSGAL